MLDRRRAWGCDCDGESHRSGARSGVELAVITRVREGIAKLVGDEPPSCPWRSFYDPLVMEVISLVRAEEKGNLGAVIGDDPPQLLLDALDVFVRARESTISHIEYQRSKKK